MTFPFKRRPVADHTNFSADHTIKGAEVKAEQRARTQSPKAAAAASNQTGVLATLRAFLRGEGTSAPVDGNCKGSGAPAGHRATTKETHTVNPLRRLALLTALASFAALLLAGPAAAATGEPAPWWHLTERLVPSRIEPEGEGTLVIDAINLGDAKAQPTSGGGAPLGVEATLPAGLELLNTEFFAPNFFAPGENLGSSFLEFCRTTGATTSCSTESKLASVDAGEPLVPYEPIEMRLTVKALPGAATGLAAITASGGGAPSVHSSPPIPLGTEAVPFGLEHFALSPESEGGGVATAAASHPYQLTTDVAFNRSSTQTLKPPAMPRDLTFKLPPGQIGNAAVYPKCSDVDFGHIEEGGATNACSDASAIGAAVVTASLSPGEEEVFTVPVFNLVPAPGEPARFGFEILRNPVVLDTSLRSGLPGSEAGDYGVTVSVRNITQVAGFLASTVTFWGAPDDPSHSESRGWGCIKGGFYSGISGQACEPSHAAKPAAFLTLPTDCAHPFDPLFEGLSWPLAAAPGGVVAKPLRYELQDAAGNPLSLTACNQVPFSPEIEAEPTSNAATSPTGLNFSIDFHDEGLLAGGGVAQSQIKKAIVTLPQGFTTNPSVAEGLQACSQAAYESETAESQPGSGCPNASKVGDVVIESPLVEEKVEGALYVAKQHDNPNSNLLTLYLIAKNPNLGILVRQALKVVPNETTGQLTTEVDNVPELPFSHFHLSFRQGQRSPLITPPACGTYTVKALLYPWARPNDPIEEQKSFQITQGPEGQGCPSGNTPPFHPGLEAGTQNNAAGTYSPFYTHISRKDSEQEITHFSIKLPPGLSGKLAGVAKCTDAQIAAAKAREHELGGQEEIEHPSCPANSEVGHTLVGTGVGNVLAYAPGKLYLAGPYKGSQISIVSITAAKVGPFDLGTVVIREGLKVNPETAQVSVDAAGSDPIPHIVDGIPVHLRDIRIYVNRPNFTINPTSCEKTSTAATVLGSGLNFASEADDQPVTVTSPFQAADCASLGFKPKLQLKLKGKTRRGGLPKLTATVTYPKQGAYANIAKTVVTLPPSEFLEQGHIGSSCTRVQFNAGAGNGAECPAKSILGHAKAITPLLDEPVEGLVYLRSNPKSMTASLSGGGTTIQFTGKVTGNKVQFQSGKCSKNDAKCKKILGSLRSLSITPKAKFLRGNSATASKKGSKIPKSMKRGGFPALRAVVTMPKGLPSGSANIAQVSVALPHSAFLAQAHLNNICTRVKFAEGEGNGADCPAGSVYGHATVITQLLDYHLEGNVYLRSNPEHNLPDLVIALQGPPSQPIALDLAGRVDSTKFGGIRTTFENAPDAPFEKFILEMQGGSKGLIENSAELCDGRTRRVTANFDGQNGKIHDIRPVLQPECPGGGKKKKK